MLDCLDSEYKPRKICVTMLRICVVQIKKYEKKKNETKSSGTDKNGRSQQNLRYRTTVASSRHDNSTEEMRWRTEKRRRGYDALKLNSKN
jgi:hypothetical protein